MSGGIAAVQGQKRRSRAPVTFTGRRGRLMIDMPDRVGGPERDAPGPSAGRLGVAMSTQRRKPHEMRSNFATHERDVVGTTVDVNVAQLPDTAAKRLSVLADSQFTQLTGLAAAEGTSTTAPEPGDHASQPSHGQAWSTGPRAPEFTPRASLGATPPSPPPEPPSRPPSAGPAQPPSPSAEPPPSPPSAGPTPPPGSPPTGPTPGTGPSSPPYHGPDGGAPRTDDSEPAAPSEPGLAFAQQACAVARGDMPPARSIRSGVLR